MAYVASKIMEQFVVGLVLEFLLVSLYLTVVKDIVYVSIQVYRQTILGLAKNKSNEIKFLLSKINALLNN